jgi:hypothetical protein
MFIKKRTAWPKNLETLNTEPTDDNLKKIFSRDGHTIKARQLIDKSHNYSIYEEFCVQTSIH